jgi:hypothetical protein
MPRKPHQTETHWWGGLSRLRTSFPTGPAGRRPACRLLLIVAPAPAVAEGRTRESIDSVPGSLTIRNASMSSASSGPGWSELPVYALVTANSGPKLHKADPDGNTNMRGVNGSFVFRSASMPQFAENLSTLSQVDRPVLDRTGIPGAFDFNLKFGESNDEMKRALIAGDGPSIFTIIQEQLGLKLEARKGPVDMLVIDHVEKVPTGN